MKAIDFRVLALSSRSVLVFNNRYLVPSKSLNGDMLARFRFTVERLAT